MKNPPFGRFFKKFFQAFDANPSHDMLGFPTLNLGWLNFGKVIWILLMEETGRNLLTTCCIWKPMKNEILSISTGAGFLPSTLGELQKRGLKSTQTQKTDVFWSNDPVMRSTVGFSKTICCLREEWMVVMRRSFRVAVFFSPIRGHLASDASSAWASDGNFCFDQELRWWSSCLCSKTVWGSQTVHASNRRRWRGPPQVVRVRSQVPGHHPNLNETILAKNLRAIVHGRYSIARGCMVRAEIDPTSLNCLPHELKEHLKLMKQQEEKKEGKEARQRKNKQKYKAGRAALFFK